MNSVSTCFLTFLPGRAYGNLGLSYESLQRYDKAVEHQLQHLSIATKMNDSAAMTLAYSSLGECALVYVIQFGDILLSCRADPSCQG
jgi:hypothetical protein